MTTPTAPALAVAALLAAACASGDRPGPSEPEPPAGPSTSALARSLDLPIAKDREDRAVAALAALADRADDGDTQAAWLRGHYLLDLFDDARFRRSDTSLRVLERALGAGDDDAEAPPSRGTQATDRALEAISRELDRVAARDRLHPGARAARTLVAYDRTPPQTRAEVYRAMGELKAIARADTPLADNARLRLYAYGRRAFEDATRAQWRDRPRVLAHALYPLYDADPEPFFADDPDDRPPPPDPVILLDELPEILGPVVTRDARLADAATSLREALTEAETISARKFPRPLDTDALELPSATAASAYDNTPRLELGDGATEPAEDLASRVVDAVLGDGRGRLALALSARAPAEAALVGGRVAALVGAPELELLVATSETYAPPAGSFWQGRLPGGRAERASVIPIRTARLSPDGSSSDAAAGLGEEPAGSMPRRGPVTPEGELDLHLVVDSAAWQLRSPEGALSPIESDTGAADPQGELTELLERVRLAFPDESSLALVPAEGASYAALVSAAAAAAAEPGFELALAAEAPEPRGDSLAPRLARRQAASVAIEPEVLEVRAAGLRRCYMELLDARPSLAGRVELARRDGEVEATRGPEPLRACATEGLSAAMREADVASARVTFSAEGSDS